MRSWPLLAAGALAAAFAGPLSAADFALYPYVKFMDRCHQRVPAFDAASLLPPALAAWKARIEALPYVADTFPPHWRES